jgi:hypothetical protein
VRGTHLKPHSAVHIPGICIRRCMIHFLCKNLLN